MINIIALFGGLFALFSFVHFFADWIFQSQREAQNKHKNPKIRAIHCTIYTLFFVPLILILTTVTWKVAVCLSILWISHFIIDTYIPVFLWARYMRKIPELQGDSAKEEFVALWQKPVYPILLIAIDQISHLTFLWAVTLVIFL